MLSLRGVRWLVRDRLPVLVSLLVALGNAVAAPYTSNQNQYLAHVEGDHPSLATDWLAGTTDPYPFFTLVAGAADALGGTSALRALAFLATWAAVWAVYVLARHLDPSGSRAVPLAAMAIVGATLVVLPPGVFLVSGTALSMFSGFGDQYVVSKPTYLQPSVAGSLVLLAFALWVRHVHDPAPARTRALAVPAVLTVLACMLHPTYMVVVLMALGAAFLADLLTGQGRSRLLAYSLLGAAVVAGALSANPGLLDLADSAVGSTEAVDRFAFERIPQHTLLTQWPLEDVWRLALVVYSLSLLPRLRSGRWLARWSAVALTASLVLAIVVELSRWTTMALLFPWRVSVIVVPLAATALATSVGLWLTRSFPGPHWERRVALVAVALAAVGLAATTSRSSPVVADESVVAVRKADPGGVGLIPLERANVRLNAGVPVYVDWKAPPYVGRELVEWWDRVDRVRRFENDPEIFCTEPWTRQVDWLLHDATGAIPSCVESWPTAATEGRWQVLVRPAPVGGGPTSRTEIR